MDTTLAAIVLAASAALDSTSTATAEKVYWDCEFAAMQGRITLDEAAACNEVYEQLKQDRFGGEFGRFLAWWQANKERELSSRSGRRQ